MPEIVVAAQSRTETGKNANHRLRAQGLIPAVLYGSGKPPQHVAVSPKEIGAILRTGRGASTLFDLEVGGGRRKVVLKDFQIEPIKGSLLHADFLEVDLAKPIHVKVHVVVHGVPVGVKTEGGFLEFITREIEVSCLPTEIPEKVDVDVSELTIGKDIRVRDVKLGERVKLLTDGDIVIVHVIGKREEVVETPEAVVAAPAAGEPEVIKKGKPEAEGEAKKDDKKKEKK